MLCPNCNTLNTQSRVRCRKCNISLFHNEQKPPATDLAPVKTSFEEPANTIPDGNTLVPVDPVQPSLEKSTPLLPDVRTEAPQEEILESESYVSSADRTITFVTFSGRKKQLILGILAVFLVAAAYVGINYLNESTSQRSAQMLFAQGEEFYREGNFFASLKIFQRFADSFPESELIPLAKARIDTLQNGLVSAEEQRIYHERRRELLLQKARAAFKSQNFVSPENDNVNAYVQELLNLEPENHEAIAMRDRLVGFLDGEGAKAMMDEDFKKATETFRSILKVLPGDEFAVERLREAEKSLAEQEETEELKEEQIRQAKRRQQSSKKLSARQTIVQKRPQKESPSPRQPARKSPPAVQQPVANDNAASKSPSTEVKDVPKQADLKQSRPANAGQASADLVSRWRSVTNYLSEDVNIVKQTDSRLVLYHTNYKEFLTLSLRKSSHTDLYAAVEQRSGQEPQLVWVTHRDLLNTPNRARRAVDFFHPEFKNRMRPPEN